MICSLYDPSLLKQPLLSRASDTLNDGDDERVYDRHFFTETSRSRDINRNGIIFSFFFFFFIENNYLGGWNHWFHKDNLLSCLYIND